MVATDVKSRGECGKSGNFVGGQGKYHVSSDCTADAVIFFQVACSTCGLFIVM